MENNYIAYTIHTLTDDEDVINFIQSKSEANDVDHDVPDVPVPADMKMISIVGEPTINEYVNAENVRYIANSIFQFSVFDL